MVLSASRRTDIPNYYSEWFLNRIKEGFLYVRNPWDMHQVSEIDISPSVVDCIVFWTKNPIPMFGKLEGLGAYQYYFQFTLTGYGADMEPNVPHKKDVMLPAFRELSERLGKGKVIWRYDPILFTGRYSPEYHVAAFSQIARSLRGCTEKCVISFVDTYAGNRKAMASLRPYRLDGARLLDFVGTLSRVASENGISMGCCAEDMDFTQCGVQPNSCIDKELVGAIIGRSLHAGKDKSQRSGCGCMESIDIGAYNTCKNGCRYCYANSSRWNLRGVYGKHRKESPLLCGELMEGDRVSRREVASLKIKQ